jgi:hypothetical protein
MIKDSQLRNSLSLYEFLAGFYLILKYSHDLSIPGH